MPWLSLIACATPVPQRDPGHTFEPDGEFVEHASREQIKQFESFELPWEP